MRNRNECETQAWPYTIPKSQQSPSLNISHSCASCPLAMAIIKQVTSCSTRTPIPKCVWEAEDQAWSQRLLAELWPRTHGFAEPSQYCAIDKWTAVFHRSCRWLLRTRRNRRNHVHQQLLGWIDRVISMLCKWETSSHSFQSSSMKSPKWDHYGF